MTTYSTEQREYWSKRPGNVLRYFTVTFEHPDITTTNLATTVDSKLFSDVTLDVLGTPTLFRATSMVVPQVTNQGEDSTQAGTITFGRIGLLFRQELLKITPLGSLSPITVTLRQYEKGVTAPVYERSLFVGSNGISFDADNVNVRISADNPAKLTKVSQFYDAETWVGLQGL